MNVTLVRTTYDGPVCECGSVMAYHNGRLVDIDESAPSWDLFAVTGREITVSRHQMTPEGDEWLSRFESDNQRLPQLAEIPKHLMENR